MDHSHPSILRILLGTVIMAVFLTVSPGVLGGAVINLAPDSPMQFSTEALTGGYNPTVSEGIDREVISEHISEQKGYLLRILPVTFKVKTITHDDGQVVVDYPWYAFLIRKQENIESES